MDSEKLLYRINSGKSLAKSEVEEVAALLEWIITDDVMRSKISLDDIYAMVLVVGRSKAFHHRHLLERYLGIADPLTVSLVLDILCLEWEQTTEYLQQLIRFAVGVAWDLEDDVKQSSIKILGEHLLKCLNPKKKGFFKRAADEPKLTDLDLQVLELLISYVKDKRTDDVTRHNAYYALCRAAGKDWSEIPSECKVLEFSSTSGDLDLEMLSHLELLLSESSSTPSKKPSSITGVRSGIR